MLRSLVGSEMCIRDRGSAEAINGVASGQGSSFLFLEPNASQGVSGRYTRLQPLDATLGQVPRALCSLWRPPLYTGTMRPELFPAGCACRCRGLKLTSRICAPNKLDCSRSAEVAALEGCSRTGALTVRASTVLHSTWKRAELFLYRKGVGEKKSGDSRILAFLMPFGAHSASVCQK